MLETCHDDLQKEYTNLVAAMLALNAKVQRRLQLLEEMQERHNAILTKVSEHKAAGEQRIELNVGGRTFWSTKDTFLRWEGTYFHSLVCGNLWKPNRDGAHYIDRDPTHFDRIMKALRTGKPVDFTGLQTLDAEQLRDEMDYYQLNKRDVPSSIMWDPSGCSANLTITEHGRTLTYTGIGDVRWSSCLLACLPNASSFKVRLKQSRGVMLGYVKTSMFHAEGENFKKSGWFLSCYHGLLYSGIADSSRIYTDRIENNSTVAIFFDKTSQTISCEVNGKPQGVAFNGVSSNDSYLLPCVEMCGRGSSVMLES